LDPKLTWDGLLTFTGGLLALFGIWIQVRHADKGLREQITAEKNARVEEAENKRKAVASGMLFEIDNFYHYYLEDLPEKVSKFSKQNPPPSLGLIPEVPFPIYHANVWMIGELDSKVISAVLEFYLRGEYFVTLTRRYRQHYEFVQQQKVAGSTADFGGMYDQARGHLADRDTLVDSAYRAEAALCYFLERPFTSERQIVAGDASISKETRDQVAVGKWTN
jgi:hypothetical protein